MSDFLKEIAEQVADKELGGDEGAVAKDLLTGDTQGAISSAEGLLGIGGSQSGDSDSDDSDDSKDDSDTDDSSDDSDDSDN